MTTKVPEGEMMNNEEEKQEIEWYYMRAYTDEFPRVDCREFLKQYPCAIRACHPAASRCTVLGSSVNNNGSDLSAVDTSGRES